MGKRGSAKLTKSLKEWNKDTENFWKKYPFYTFIVFSLISFSVSVLMGTFVWKETLNLNEDIIGSILFGLIFTWFFTRTPKKG